MELGDGVDEARETPLLQVLVQAYDPTINGYDFVVQVRFEELVVVASPALLMGNLSHPHAAWLRALQSFFAGDDVRYYLSELEALWLTKMHGLRETMKQNRAYLKSLLASNGKLTVLDIDVEAPVLVVPEDPSSVLTPYLMLDLGRVRVATEALRDAARAAMLHNGEEGGAYGLQWQIWRMRRQCRKSWRRPRDGRVCALKEMATYGGAGHATALETFYRRCYAHGTFLTN